MILLSGPCVIEDEKRLYAVAKGLEFAHLDDSIDFYFKASFDKANRTSLDGFRGPGLERGLALLQKIKQDFGYKIITDVHESAQVKSVAEVADVLQIPAFLCRQTDLIVESAKTGRIVNIKKGQFMNPADMRYSVLKALRTKLPDLASENLTSYHDLSRDNGIWLTERGSSFGYGNLVVDMRSLVIMRNFAPVIFDATHSVQLPGGMGGSSGGDSSFVPHLARAAASVGVAGFFMETHVNPKEALSDGANMISLANLPRLLETLKALDSLALEAATLG